MEWSHPEALALAGLSEVFQIRLREQLREKMMGAVYSVGVDAEAKRLPDPEYRLAVEFDSDPERTDELVEEVLSCRRLGNRRERAELSGQGQGGS